jgi:hypothetical protein
MPSTNVPPSGSSLFHWDSWAAPYFTVERAEAGDLLALVAAKERVMIEGPRRCGKTTMVINTMEGEGFDVLHIDLNGLQTPEGIRSRVDASKGRFLRDHPDVLESLAGKRISKSTVKAGVPGIGGSLETNSEVSTELGTSLDAILDAVTEVAQQTNAVVFVDEFQAVNKPDMGGEVESAFAAASSPQRTRGKVSWVFAGSDRHAMHNIFHKDGSLFANRRELFVGPIPEDTIIPFLNGRTGCDVAPAVGHAAYKWTEGIPADLQRLYGSIMKTLRTPGKITLRELNSAQADVMQSLLNKHADYASRITARNPDRLRLLTCIARHNVRTAEQLVEIADGENFEPEQCDQAFNGLVDTGVLHHNRATGAIERPEPLFFHYLVATEADTHFAGNAARSPSGDLAAARRRKGKLPPLNTPTTPTPEPGTEPK